MPEFIYINGFPGVGKLTVANEVSKLIPGSRVFHNHLVIDPVAAVLDRGSRGYDELRAGFRRHALHTIATHQALRGTTFIFTDSRESSGVGSEGARDYQKAAEMRGVPFISIILHCGLSENLRRLESRNDISERGTKLTDGGVLRTIRETEEIFRFGGNLEKEVDTTYMRPSETAQMIVQHVSAVTGEKIEINIIHPYPSRDASLL